ncbi:Uncharacterized protein QTN25_006797 [Entamoeba marina]
MKLLLISLVVMGKFCDGDAFEKAVDEANTCMSSNTDVCSCLLIQKNAIKDASCAAEPLKTFFKDGCLSFGCDSDLCGNFSTEEEE